MYLIGSSPHPFLIRVNKFLPSLLLCYFVPGIARMCLPQNRMLRSLCHAP